MKILSLRRIRGRAKSAISILVCVLFFQNCSEVQFSDASRVGQLDICEGVSCVLDPLTDKAAVTTVLLALGDEANDQLVVSGASSQLVAETVVRYSSPKNNPKILLVKGWQSRNESPEDTIYVRDSLLKRYDVKFIIESGNGLRPSDLVGYDMVWYNNPGYPMSLQVTRDTLIDFEGAVVLQGDDLSRGQGFSLEPLTGLTYVDNGATVTCAGQNYAHDNNYGQQYRVALDPNRIPGADSSTIQFRYGNDIDQTRVARNDLEVLATAVGGPTTCTQSRPTIVRYIHEVEAP